jgi:hypothetical protein
MHHMRSSYDSFALPCTPPLQVKVWRRHLHKFEDMDVATAEAKAEELKVKVLAARAAKAEALGLPVKTKTAPADQVGMFTIFRATRPQTRHHLQQDSQQDWVGASGLIGLSYDYGSAGTTQQYRSCALLALTAHATSPPLIAGALLLVFCPAGQARG